MKKTILIGVLIITILLISGCVQPKKPGPGESCTHWGDCQRWPIYVCNPKTNLCERRLGDPGTVCDLEDDCKGYPDFQCIRNIGDASGTCIRVTGREVGEECKDSKECKQYPFAGCINLKCREGPNEGCDAGQVPRTSKNVTFCTGGI